MKSETMQEIEKLEATIENAKGTVDTGAKLERLLKNDDFNDLINELYLKDEPVRITYLLGDPEYASKEAREPLVRDLEAIANFRTFLGAVLALSRQAQAKIISTQAELDELRKEG